MPYVEENHYGKCAHPICSKASELTARISVFDGTWVGGAEAYQPCCEEHHAIMDVFTFPGALIQNWDEIGLDEELFYSILSINSTSELCEMLNALVTSLQHPKIPLLAAGCPRCAHIHVDKERWAHTAHVTHLCEKCGTHFEVADHGTSNKLVVCAPRLTHPKP